MPTARNFFTEDEQQQIIDAIQKAESHTSGEIRLHLEDFCPKADALERAEALFGKLGMQQTELKNGVLFYLAVKDHKFAIYGGKGIHEVVPDGFWDHIKEHMQKNFKAGDFLGGLTEGIEMSGHALKEHFPVQADDENELPDDISFRE
jgi:uncharacterized membrane protein